MPEPTPDEVNASLEAMGSSYRIPAQSKAGTTWAEEERLRSTPGTVEKANLDTGRRPHVQNADGSVSTVRSMGFEDRNGQQVLVPTVSVKGNMMTPEEAEAEYYRTGQHLGKFGTPQESDRAAEALHNEHAQHMPEDTLGGSGGRGMSVEEINAERRYFKEPEMSPEEIQYGQEYATAAARRAVNSLKE